MPPSAPPFSETADARASSGVAEFLPEIGAFIDHWRGLRAAGTLVPRSRDFLDRPNARLQPFVSFNDFHPDGSDVVSLYAAGLVESWGRDLTGLPMKAFLAPDAVIRLGTDLKTCGAHPCAMWEVAGFTTSQARSVKAEIVTLPLDLERPGAFRIVRYHRQVEKLVTAEHIAGVFKALQKQWIDIGAGIPSRAPMLLAD